MEGKFLEGVSGKERKRGRETEYDMRRIQLVGWKLLM